MAAVPAQKPLGVVNEALQQIAYADRLVLNKTDLATPAELDDLETRLRDINSLAQARACSHARTPAGMSRKPASWTAAQSCM